MANDFERWPRLAASAVPAAICCFLDFAGIPKFRTGSIDWPLLTFGGKTAVFSGARRGTTPNQEGADGSKPEWRKSTR